MHQGKHVHTSSSKNRHTIYNYESTQKNQHSSVYAMQTKFCNPLNHQLHGYYGFIILALITHYIQQQRKTLQLLCKDACSCCIDMYA